MALAPAAFGCWSNWQAEPSRGPQIVAPRERPDLPRRAARRDHRYFLDAEGFVR